MIFGGFAPVVAMQKYMACGLRTYPGTGAFERFISVVDNLKRPASAMAAWLQMTNPVPGKSPRDPRAAVYTNNFETDVSS